ncbi:20354_t:CDS:1, partial [Dentiscutata erythropus]
QGAPSNSQPIPENIEFIIPLDKDNEQTLQQAVTLSLQDSADENFTESEPIQLDN